MDGFEGNKGYSERFGLHQVDFVDGNRPRTPKQSAYFFAQIIEQNGFVSRKQDHFEGVKISPPRRSTPLPPSEVPSASKVVWEKFTPQKKFDRQMYHYGNFSQNFLWGVSSSAYQIEGAWRQGGKGLSIWDKFTHTPGNILQHDTGDIACNSYNKMEDDIAALKKVKVSHYRFSVSWPRILPDGTTEYINQAGLNYYKKLLDSLIAANIQPQVTLYHWDLPQALQDVGGWENETIIERFRDYADILFENLGPKVQLWITFNEPFIIAILGHVQGTHAPGILLSMHDRPDTLPYIVSHNIIKAHAEAWHVYNDKYRASQNGMVSITVNADWAEPRNPYKQEDYDAARSVFYLGWYAHPIFNGDYSPLMKRSVLEQSLAGGLTKSRLPEFTPEEIKRINGTYDYFGLNHYCTKSWTNSCYRGVVLLRDRTWLESGSHWLTMTPFGLRRLLKFIKHEFGNPPIIITENGVSENGPVDLNDVHRKYFYEKYINQVLKAYLLDDVNVIGYTAWSLLDNLEWAVGYTERFGLFYVNRSDPDLSRTPKASVSFYSSIISCNGFPDPASGTHECWNSTSTPTPTLTPKPEGKKINFLQSILSFSDSWSDQRFSKIKIQIETYTTLIHLT
uniref:Lactase n=1 Tax=Xiphophorus maculatus TaxID=8083 RepID=A0A3B5QN64_XIPMA